MKNNTIRVLIVFAIYLLSACASNNAPKQQTDTVAKADVTKDTLGIDTNKSIVRHSKLIKNDTSKKVRAKQ
ncbi:MAG: hypothetical protein JWP45_1282 [Mucilaginibacter sp.]|nr:hypothetical protein [Mucilaginibacter sp.]